MSVLSLFHPNPYDQRALKPGYKRPTPEPTARQTPIVKEQQSPKQEDKDGEVKSNPPKVTDPNTKFIEYKVRASDDLDLWNVAATYGVRVEDIRRYNRRVVFDYLDNVIGETIYIPINVQEGDHIPKQPEADPKKIAEFKFVKDTGASHAEAKYYLEETNWEYEEAIKTFKDDVNWEKSKESKEKAHQLEKIKAESGTPSEKLAAVIAPLSSTISSSSSSSIDLDTSISEPSQIFPPPSYSFEGLNSSVSMQQFPPSSTTNPPAWEPQSQLKSLKKPLLVNEYSS